MIVLYTTVFFAAIVLTGFSIGACQLDWLYFIGPIGAYVLWHLVKSVLRDGRRYRGIHALTSVCTFVALLFAMLTLFQIPDGSWARALQNGSLVVVYIWLIYRNRQTYDQRLEIDAKVQEWKDEARRREEKWAEMYDVKF